MLKNYLKHNVNSEAAVCKRKIKMIFTKTETYTKQVSGVTDLPMSPKNPT